MQQQQVQKLPSKDEVQAQLTQLILQRANFKDQIEQIEKQVVPLQTILQVLTAQEAEAAKAEIVD